MKAKYAELQLNSKRLDELKVELEEKVQGLSDELN